MARRLPSTRGRSARVSRPRNSLALVTDLLVRATALKWTSDDFPGWVEVVVDDWKGQAHHIVEKVPVLTMYELSADSVFPVELWLRGQIEEADAQKVTLALDAGVETVDGLQRLTVPTRLGCRGVETGAIGLIDHLG